MTWILFDNLERVLWAEKSKESSRCFAAHDSNVCIEVHEISYFCEVLDHQNIRSSLMYRSFVNSLLKQKMAKVQMQQWCRCLFSRISKEITHIADSRLSVWLSRSERKSKKAVTSLLEVCDLRQVSENRSVWFWERESETALGFFINGADTWETFDAIRETCLSHCNVWTQSSLGGRKTKIWTSFDFFVFLILKKNCVRLKLGVRAVLRHSLPIGAFLAYKLEPKRDFWSFRAEISSHEGKKVTEKEKMCKICECEKE